MSSTIPQDPGPGDGFLNGPLAPDKWLREFEKKKIMIDSIGREKSDLSSLFYRNGTDPGREGLRNPWKNHWPQSPFGDIPPGICPTIPSLADKKQRLLISVIAGTA